MIQELREELELSKSSTQRLTQEVLTLLNLQLARSINAVRTIENNEKNTLGKTRATRL